MINPIRMSFTLRQKINGAICATFIVIALFFTAIEIPFQHHRLERSVAAIETLLDTLVERDSAQLANEIFDMRVTAIAMRIAEMLTVEGILAIGVYDSTGGLLAETAVADFEPGPDEAAGFAKPPGSTDERALWREGDTLYFQRNIDFLGERLGAIHIIYSLADVRADRKNSLLIFTCLLLTILLVMLVVLNLILSRAILEPVRYLDEAAQSIAMGNLDRNIDMDSGDELASLAASFAKMRDAVKEKIATLRSEVDERKRAEDNLRITLDSIGDGVITTDVAGRITGMNPVAETLTGWEGKAALGKMLAEVFRVVRASDRAAVEDPATRVMRSGKIEGLSKDALLLARDGSEYLIADSGAPIRSKGENLGVVLVFRDITEEKSLQDQLRQSQKMDAIGQLAGGVAHDFNNMLGGIMGAAEMSSLYIKDNPEAQKFNSIILESAKRAADLTGKLLTFSRSNPQTSVAVDVHAVIEESVVLLKNTIDRRIEILIRLAADKKTVTGDATLLQNLLLNLGINSWHAMPEGGRISITTDEVELGEVFCSASAFSLAPGKYLRIHFRDSGTGIPAEQLERVFDPFFTTKGPGRGTGLGLAAVYGTVQQHRGAIFVESEPQKGTTFQILLPLAGAEAVETVEVAEKAKRGKGRILIIDDEEVMRVTAQAILVDLGYDVTTATDGGEGLALFAADPDGYDLVLLDMTMPVMNGRDCFAALRQHNPDIAVLVSSGFTREEDLREMKLGGLNGYIRKPYLSTDLSRAIHDILATVQ